MARTPVCRVRRANAAHSIEPSLTRIATPANRRCWVPTIRLARGGHSFSSNRQRHGERPSVANAEERLNLIHNLGPSPDAFIFAKLFDPMGRPVVRGSRMDRECGV